MKTSSIIILIIVIILIAIGVWLLIMPKGQNKPAQQEQTAGLTQPLNQQSQEQNQNQQTSNSFNIQGMKVDILKEGTGVAAKVGDTVTVNYTGTLTDGTKFDSSLNPGRTPFQFTLGQNRVIQGWELGVLGMKVGEKRKLTIPPELGYGSQTVGPIPADSTLLFEVDLLGINQ